MKEKTDTRKQAIDREIERDGELDWRSLFAAFEDALEWALDVAKAFAHGFPEEVEAVERLRRFMRARIAGRTAHVRIDDVLFTFGLVIAAIAHVVDEEAL